MTAAALAVIALTSPLLFAYGANLLYLSSRALSLAPPPRAPARRKEPALVAVQLPIYNERYVAERVIDGACGLHWPRGQLEVQVLDDSDDETVAIVERAVDRWRRRGTNISHIRRSGRRGYKAGALAEGMGRTEAAFLAVFDADSLPPPDFLQKTIGEFEDPAVGYVQARWTHHNESYSWFTRLQALMIDFHFLVEQPVRAALGYPTNFAGSAGVWRRAAVEDSGGWSARTLTEDLDLSYRAQLRGWRAAYREDVAVPQEVPVAVNGYRAQQSRWAQGSFQCAFRMLGPLLWSRMPPGAKLQGTLHLLGYLAPVLMLIQIAAYPSLLLETRGTGGLSHLVRLPVAVSLMSLAPFIGFAVAQHRRGRPWFRQLPGIASWAVVGSGTSLAVTLSLFRALRGGGQFRRTPKYRIERPGQQWTATAYATAVEPIAVAELGLGLAACVLGVAAVTRGEWLLEIYSLLFASGFLCLALGSLGQGLEVVSLRRLGRRLPAGLYRARSFALLLALPAVLLLAAAQLPDPFEDSYQHWLLAATLAQTGHLRDPLFGMQDTWLPGYQVLAALVLRLTGLWNLWLLKLVNAGLGLVTLYLVYRLAGSARRGRFAVALLALNPIFLLTATTAVAEPLLVASLLGAVAATRAGRPLPAAALGVLACLTGTKAWLWLLALAAVLLVQWGLSRRWSPLLQRAAWVLPALVLAGLLEATFGFASHSAARGALEAASAATRGSLPSSGSVRGAQFLWFLVVASLPLVALTPVGLVSAIRRLAGPGDADEGDAFLLRTVHLPSLLYLGCVTALVASGVYSGSHRYYYPALPALALLAASALDRYATPIGVAATAAAGVVTIAFVPVLGGLAADNRGLVAAGQAAATLPGALLTDSPVAAYWSHKSPDRIYGSEQLPADPARAAPWLRAQQVNGVVSEDIDYYRLGAVFPGLPQGHPQSGFQLLGDQSSYSVPGGKRVFVYEWAALRARVSLGRGLEVATAAGTPDSPAPGQAAGKSAVLAKGPLLLVDGAATSGEGVGFGVPAVHDGAGWHYPGSSQFADLGGAGRVAWQVTYDLDLAGGDSQHWYALQAAPSRGRVAVTYRVSGSKLSVQVQPLDLTPGWDQLVMLNEGSSQFDDFADSTRTGTAGFRAWQPVQGSWARLRSSRLGVEWELPAPPPGAGFLAGRELQPPDLDWAGIEYQFGPTFRGFSYDVNFRRSG
jgi:cellulose synthase/poly-beta-1,6-N-acetylglucosamine synthase-like glycosyltransferase